MYSITITCHDWILSFSIGNISVFISLQTWITIGKVSPLSKYPLEKTNIYFGAKEKRDHEGRTCC